MSRQKQEKATIAPYCSHPAATGACHGPRSVSKSSVRRDSTLKGMNEHALPWQIWAPGANMVLSAIRHSKSCKTQLVQPCRRPSAGSVRLGVRSEYAHRGLSIRQPVISRAIEDTVHASAGRRTGAGDEARASFWPGALPTAVSPTHDEWVS